MDSNSNGDGSGLSDLGWLMFFVGLVGVIGFILTCGAAGN